MSDIVIFTYQNQPLFHYNTRQRNLTCPECQKIYDINAQGLKNVIAEAIESHLYDLPYLMMRCIECDLNRPGYTFKHQDALVLNAGQKLVIERLYKQLVIIPTTEDTNQTKFYLIEGYAGTGKTTVIAYLLKYPEFSKFRIGFSAPTNQALNVLNSKVNTKNNETYIDLEIPDEDKSWSFKTVFKLLDNKMVISSQGETLFQKNESGGMTSKNELIVIDEVSMVDKSQMGQVFQFMDTVQSENRFGLNSIPTIVFLGDEAQLPPIHEEVSIIFDPQIQIKHKIKCLALTQIMRSQDRITELAIKVRNLIPMHLDAKIKSDWPAIDLKTMICDQISVCTDRSQWVDNYVKEFQGVLQEHPDNPSLYAPIILSYSNPERIALNTQCRDQIFNNPENKYVTGELVIFDGYHKLTRKKKTDGKTEFYYVSFYTSETSMIKQVAEGKITVDPLDWSRIFKTKDTLYENLQKKIDKGKFRKVEKDYLQKELDKIMNRWQIGETLLTHEATLDGHLAQMRTRINKVKQTYQVYFLGLHAPQKLDEYDTDPEPITIKVIKDKDRAKYDLLVKEIKSRLRMTYETLIKIYGKSSLMSVIIDYLFYQIWVQYFYLQLVWPFADISYGYCITTHKSQGSTYRSIYPNIPNIIGCHKVSSLVRAKSLYTAIGRASKSVKLLHNQWILVPFLPTEPRVCEVCDVSKAMTLYPTVNFTIDKACADHILNSISIVSLSEHPKNPEQGIYSDKNKVLYVIPKDQLEDFHVNDAMQYIQTAGLTRPFIDRYQYSNLELAKLISV